MSGGSFDYLYAKGPGEILDSESLPHMAAELEALGYDAKDVAERTRSLVDLREHIAAEVAALGPIWHAVEWWRSCDWSRDRVLIAIGEYRERQKRAA